MGTVPQNGQTVPQSRSENDFKVAFHRFFKESTEIRLMGKKANVSHTHAAATKPRRKTSVDMPSCFVSPGVRLFDWLGMCVCAF